MSIPGENTGEIPPVDLAEFLNTAYDPASMHDLLSGRLAQGVSISGIVPQRAHLTKDGRLVVAYRLQLFHDRHGICELPMFLHNTEQSKLKVSKDYRSMETSKTFHGNCFVRRLYIKADPSMFISIFPLDPQLRTPVNFAKPGDLLALYNRDLKEPGAKPATSVEKQLMGYRPERRAIFKFYVNALPDERTVVVKLYRRQEAGRVWKMCRSLARNLEAVPGVTLPFAHSNAAGALSYPFRQGETLHNLLEQHLATTADLRCAGKVLRQLHAALPSGDVNPQVLRTFTFAREWEILGRWRRFLKYANSSHAGSVAKYVRILKRLQSTAPAPDALLHRDFYPKQLLLHPWTRDQALVDLDTMAYGPAALDVGNFLAHLHLHSAAPATVKQWRKAFLAGYGNINAKDVALFELTSVLRMYCLALVNPPVSGLLERLIIKIRKLERSLR